MDAVPDSIHGTVSYLQSVGLSYTNNLIDVPMARCYINSYMDHHESFAATLEKMMGKSEFKGRYNENVFCGRWETRF